MTFVQTSYCITYDVTANCGVLTIYAVSLCDKEILPYVTVLDYIIHVSLMFLVFHVLHLTLTLNLIFTLTFVQCKHVAYKLFFDKLSLVVKKT